VSDVIRAAGGLVFTRNPNGKLRVLLVHRPAYDDWALPKGKAEDGETPEDTAVREVLEETGYHCRIVTGLGSTEHRTADGTKHVTWYAMRPLPDSPGFEPNHEIDGVRWLSPKSALKLADYENDRDLIAGARLKRLSGTGTLRLLRHAVAGDRSAWKGDDVDRPLTAKGRRQADALALELGAAGIDMLVSSPYARCVQTLEPLAEVIGARIVTDERLAESRRIEPALELVDSLAGHNAVVCSHGDVIPAVLEALRDRGLGLPSRIHCSKGSTWEIDVTAGRPVAAAYRPPADT
jgi:8-oxo-dGTP diphosphatase